MKPAFPTSRQTRRGLSSLGRTLPQLTKPLLANYSRIEQTLFLEWARIIGREYAKKTTPQRLSFPDKKEKLNAVLWLWVDPSVAFSIAHSHPQIVERINAYFGFSLIARLKIKQSRFESAASESKARDMLQKTNMPLDSEMHKALKDKVAGFKDLQLQEAIYRLSHAVYVEGEKSSDIAKSK